MFMVPVPNASMLVSDWLILLALGWLFQADSNNADM